MIDESNLAELSLMIGILYGIVNSHRVHLTNDQDNLLKRIENRIDDLYYGEQE